MYVYKLGVKTFFAYAFPLNFTFRVWDAFFVKGFSFALQVHPNALVLESQLPQQIVKLLFTTTSYNIKLTVVWVNRLSKTTYEHFL